MKFKQTILVQEGLDLTPEELAIHVANASMAFLMEEIRENMKDYSPYKFEVFGEGLTHTDENGIVFYRRPDLYNWAKEAAARGERYFYCKPVDETDIYGDRELCEPVNMWRVSMPIDEGWLNIEREILKVKDLREVEDGFPVYSRIGEEDILVCVGLKPKYE